MTASAPDPDLPSRQTRRPLLTLAAAWVLGAVLLCFFDQWLAETLWILSLVLDAIWLVVGVVLLVASAALTASRARRREAAPAFLLLAVAGAGVWLGGSRLEWYGTHWLMRTRFEHRLPGYRLAVATLQKQPQSAGWHHDGRAGDFVVDSGPPLRVAFPWPGGMLDNWQGIVYDPSGVVLQAGQFRSDWSNFEDPALQRVKRMFGGDMHHCEAMGGPWYFCQFT